MKKTKLKVSEPFFGKISKIGTLWPDRTAKKQMQYFIPKAILHSQLAQSIVRAQPHVISNFLRARRLALENPSKTVSYGQVELKRLTGTVGGLSASEYYRMNIGKLSFFVKEFNRAHLGPRFNSSLEDAAVQMKTLERAKNALREDPRFSQFVVAEPHFAFSGSDSMYLVSQYHVGVPVNQIRSSAKLAREVSWSAHDEKMIKDLADYLENKKSIFDANDYNILWCKDIHKFVIIDVRGA